jgi:hypothetical protein
MHVLPCPTVVEFLMGCFRETAFDGSVVVRLERLWNQNRVLYFKM